jgi:hypothetical protein
LEPSSAIPSSSSSDESSSTDELPSTRPVRQRRAPDRYSPSQYNLFYCLRADFLSGC